MADGMSIGRLFVELAVERGDYDRDLDQAAQVFDRASQRLTEAARKTGTRLDGAFEAMGKAARQATEAMGQGLAQAAERVEAPVDGASKSLAKATARLEQFAASGTALDKAELRFKRAREEIERLAAETGNGALAARALEGAETQLAAARERAAKRAADAAARVEAAQVKAAREAAKAQDLLAKQTQQATRRLEDLAAQGDEVQQLVLKLRRVREEAQQLAAVTGDSALVSKAVAGAERDLAKAVADRNKASAEAAGGSKALAGGLQSVAVQIPDVISQLSAGTPVTQVFAQQGLQVVQQALVGVQFNLAKMVAGLKVALPILGAAALAAAAAATAYALWRNQTEKTDEANGRLNARLEEAREAAARAREKVDELRDSWREFVNASATIQDRLDIINGKLTEGEVALRDNIEALREQSAEQVRASARQVKELERRAAAARDILNDETTNFRDRAKAAEELDDALRKLPDARREFAERKALVELRITQLEQEAEYNAELAEEEERQRRLAEERRAAAAAAREGAAAIREQQQAMEALFTLIRDAEADLQRSTDLLALLQANAPDAVPVALVDRLRQLSEATDALVPPETLGRLDQLQLLLNELELQAAKSGIAERALAEDISRVSQAIIDELVDAAQASAGELEQVERDLRQIVAGLERVTTTADVLGNAGKAAFDRLLPGASALTDRVAALKSAVDDGTLTRFAAGVEGIGAAFAMALERAQSFVGLVTGGQLSSLLNPASLVSGAGNATQQAEQQLEDQAVEEARASAEAAGEEFDEDAFREAFQPDPEELAAAQREAAKAFVEEQVNGVVAFVEAVAANLDVILQALIEGIPRIVDALVANLPTIIQAIIRNLPQIALQLIIGIVRVLPVLFVELAKGIVELFIDGGRALIEFLGEPFRTLFADIIPNIAEKIADGVRKIFDGVKNFFRDLVQEIVTLGIAETATFGDTPGPVRAGADGLLARFAPKDIVVAAQDPAELYRQAVQAMQEAGRPVPVSGSAPPAAGGSRPFRMESNTSVRLELDGATVATATVRTAKSGRAPEVDQALQAGRGVRRGFDRGGFSAFSG